MRSARLALNASAGILAAALLGTRGVPAGATAGDVPKSVVEAQAAKVLAAETGQESPSVKCPGDLQGKVGATLRCVLIPKGSKLKYPVVVTVGSVHNGT